MRGDGGSPTRTARRMSVYFTDTGMALSPPRSKLETDFRDAICQVDTTRQSQHTSVQANMTHIRIHTHAHTYAAFGTLASCAYARH